jgi:hypothetical protein
MKITSLAKLLTGSLAAADFSAEIAVELAEHTRLLGRGGSVPVVVTEDADLLLDRQKLALLCQLFVSGQLTTAQVAYTADVLQLAERIDFSGPDIANDLDWCTDPEINGPFTAERALEIAERGSAA